MIEVKTVLNNARKESEEYCFSSVASKTAGTAEIASRMREFNSTLTVADAIAALSVLDQTVRSLLKEGCKVNLPWVTLYFAAHGKAESRVSRFSTGKDGNKLVLKSVSNKEVEKELSHSVAYKSEAGEIVKAPRILALYSLASDGSTSDILSFAAGSTLRLHGHNLKFDFADEKQGVFFSRSSNHTSTGVYARATSFTRIAANTVDVTIPESLATGIYEVSIVKKEKSRGYLTDISSALIEVK